MDEKLEALLFQVAGFLNLMVKGLTPVPDHAKKEAEELLNKLGEVLAEMDSE